MRKLLLITFAIAVTVIADAQQFKMDKIYAQFGTDATELKSVYNNKWVITASTSKFLEDPKLPADYKATVHPGSDVLDFFLVILSFGFYEPGSLPDTYSLDPTNVRFSHLAFGRFYPLTRSISFTADAGIGVATADRYVFRKTTVTNKVRNAYFNYSDNYDITVKNVANVGGIVRVGFDWAFSSVAGLGIDAFYNYNAGGIKSHSGVNVKLMFGWMNKPAKAKKTWN